MSKVALNERKVKEEKEKKPRKTYEEVKKENEEKLAKLEKQNEKKLESLKYQQKTRLIEFKFNNYFNENDEDEKKKRRLKQLLEDYIYALVLEKNDLKNGIINFVILEEDKKIVSDFFEKKANDIPVNNNQLATVATDIQGENPNFEANNQDTDQNSSDKNPNNFSI